MAKISKKRTAILERIPEQPQAIEGALALVKELASAKFDETVEVAFNLGIDPRKSDQVVRGAALMPHGIGKQVRVAVFAGGVAADAATAAGADVVGLDDLAETMKGGDLNFDVVIAAPDAMKVVGALGQLLGPRGLMPNPKVGTVTPDVAQAVENAKKGQVRFRADKGGVVHCAIGKVSFEVNALHENLDSLAAELRKLKPAAAKGNYFQKLTVSSTMGIGVPVDLSSLSV
ncbi:MAG: 50S ribosomal protein L1 [Pseudomonadota bacterium]|nr:50S ribosomal protein L1 [Pseudomonadota bacterium]